MIAIDDKEILTFIKTLKECSSYDLTDYSLSSLKRRITKILMVNNIGIETLNNKITEDKAFAEIIFKKITVCITDFFRDPEMWINLRHEILSHYTDTNGLRIWHVGCSTGQEVYSMMIMLNEINFLHKSEIYATDINQDALDQATAGKYPYMYNTVYLDNFDRVINESAENNSTRKNIPYTKYFTVDPDNDIIQMKSFLANKPVYKKIDLVKVENPFKVKFDLIFCRNVTIYFNQELQNRVLNLFYRDLKDSGSIVLGIHEKLIDLPGFEFDKKLKGYHIII